MQIVIGIALAVAILGSYLYWRYWYLITGKRYLGLDLIFSGVIMALLFSRIAGLIVNYYLTGGFPRLLNIFNFFDLNFNYFVLVFMPVLAYQFFVFNFELERKWYVRAISAHLLGILWLGLVVAIQLFRAVSLGWGTKYTIFHGGLLLTLLISGLVIYLGNKRKSYRWGGLLSLTCTLVGFTALALGSGIFSLEQARWEVIVMVFVGILTAVPYVRYLFYSNRRRDLAEVRNV